MTSYRQAQANPEHDRMAALVKTVRAEERRRCADWVRNLAVAVNPDDVDFTDLIEAIENGRPAP